MELGEPQLNTQTNLKYIPCRACADWKCQFSRNLCPQCSSEMRIIRKGLVIQVYDVKLGYNNRINNEPMGFTCDTCICNFGLKGQKL